MSWIEEQTWFGLELEDIEMIENDFEEVVKILFLTKYLWTTKNHYQIHLSDMKINHIQNCLNKCKRENWRLWAISLLEQELNKRK